ELLAIDVELGRVPAQAAVAHALLVARVLGLHGALLVAHGVGLVDHDAAAGRGEQEDLLAVVWREPPVDAGPDDDVRDAERSGQKLDVRQYVALALRENAGRRLEVGGGLRQGDDLVAGVAVLRWAHAQPTHGEPRVQRPYAAVDGGAEYVVA